MSLKRKTGINASFSMASMTDVIFLLLIFFMVTSMLVFPNAIKVLLPQSSNQVAETPTARITIDASLNYFISYSDGKAVPVNIEELNAAVRAIAAENEMPFVALYADETIPYGEVVKVLNIGVENNIRMVLATRPVNN